MTKLIIGVSIYAAIGVVLQSVGLEITDWKYWSVFALVIAAECNERVFS
jgi:hypothetical protein